MSLDAHTAWLGSDIVVSRGEEVIDRIPGAEIRRVVFVYRDGGETPGDFAYALFELPEAFVILPPESGIAGRVHFERQAFWEARACTWWVDEAQASLPARYRPTGWWFRRRASPPYRRLPSAELGPLLDEWPLEGPQTWQQRKWRRIEANRPLADLPLHGAAHHGEARRSLRA